jgi:hypothetical protein
MDRLFDLRQLLLVLYAVAAISVAPAAWSETSEEEVIGEFLLLLLATPECKREALQFVDRNWREGFTPMLVEILTFNRDPAFGTELVSLLEAKTGQRHGFDLDRWFRWQWNRDFTPYPQYAEFKSALYGMIDPAFEAYFDGDRATTIRLDEVVWGGVEQDGIPPLRDPDMIRGASADYLADTDVVFGISVNGDARAYPRRILGWHEMFVDRVGGVPVAGVYCTLCGTMILYRTEAGGSEHQLGTSGFLYRSNKLMYDRATQSLWNTLWGEPVIGPLAGRDIALERMSVVTTTWGEWRRRHPDTRVLSMKTGHIRDYSEGAAYRDYYASDELMFQVPERDTRLKNKDEILGLIFPGSPGEPLAISVEYLARNPLYHDALGDVGFVVLTDTTGASRVYEAGGRAFTRWDGNVTAKDSSGMAWTLSEERLIATDGKVLHRLPAQRAFWFGWFSAYSHTRLVH